MKNAKLIELEIDEIYVEILKWEKDLNTARNRQLKDGNQSDFIFVKGCEDLLMCLHSKIVALKWVIQK